MIITPEKEIWYMARFRKSRWTVGALLAVGSVLLASFSLFFSAQADQERQTTESYCLSCHNDPGLEMQLPSGETLSLYIDPDSLTHSIHSPIGIECEACHTDIQSYPHPKLDVNSQRELSLTYVNACEKCHSGIYEKTQDSIHEQVAETGNASAPVCTDCHGAHDIQPPNQPRARVSETCGKCHEGIYETYTHSIHGSALLQENNPDVPVCTDCHGVHNIQDPRTSQFRVETPELCAGCHANAQLMSKYGLPSNVYDLYELSWHGVDVSVYEARWPSIWHNSAVCTDCHGIHNILPASDPQSTVNPANLLVTCQKCHPTAGPNWVGAWTGHNEISQERTPWLYYVRSFYDYFVPAVLWVSILYVLLQILHATVERVKRSLA
jgi:predicted CXXCH cytochrome family protein